MDGADRGQFRIGQEQRLCMTFAIEGGGRRPHSATSRSRSFFTDEKAAEVPVAASIIAPRNER
jgi:hypothetical protein